MSAIEMMDPKMDAGMIGNQVNRKVLNFEQAIKVGTLCVFVSCLVIHENDYHHLMNSNMLNFKFKAVCNFRST